MVGLVGFRFLLVVARFCRDCWGYCVMLVGWLVLLACLLWRGAGVWCFIFNSVV